MIEIRIHGRGGQGVVAASEILAIAFFKDGKESQAFPYFGVERSGAPIQSFVRVSEEKILTREHVYSPDILIIQDDSLIGRENIFFGLKEGGKIFLNSKESARDMFLKIKKLKQLPANFKEENISTINATKVALEVFGRNIVNTAMLGSLAKSPGLLKIDSAISAIKEKFSDKSVDIIEKNILVIKKIYNS